MATTRLNRWHWTHIINIPSRPVLRVLVVSGIVRCYPIIYYNQKARNAVTNYFRALPSVLQWIGTRHHADAVIRSELTTIHKLDSL